MHEKVLEYKNDLINVRYHQIVLFFYFQLYLLCQPPLPFWISVPHLSSESRSQMASTVSQHRDLWPESHL